MTPAIRVENLGKSYRVNHAEERLPYKTLRDSIARVASAPIRRFRAGGHSGVVEQFWALNDVNFDIEPGEVVGIIGRNGAGKSTLLKILSRITRPTTGRVTINGRVGSLLEVGTGFHPELTGRENIYMNGSILGMSKAEIRSKFDEIVEFSGVEKFLDTPVKRYSSGMQVRLAFAVAANLDPEILIIDEVLAVGDAEFQRQCMGKMQDVATGGRTVILVSHNMAAIQNFSTRAMVIDSGSMKFFGDVDEGIRLYLDGYQASATHNLSSIRRGHSYEPVFQSIDFLDAKGIQVASVPAGSPLRIEIGYALTRPVEHPYFGVAIDTQMGVRVTLLHTRIQQQGFTASHSTGKVICDIPKMMLIPGRYMITLSHGSGTTEIDRLERVCTLDVISNDYFGTGHLPSTQQAIVLMDSSWKAVSRASQDLSFNSPSLTSNDCSRSFVPTSGEI